MIRYVIRNKATGQFLSYRPSGGKRAWINGVDKIGLFRRLCDVSNSLRGIPEVAQWLKDKQRRSIPRAWMRPADFPVEIVEFSVVLIDNGKGFLTKTELEGQLNGP